MEPEFFSDRFSKRAQISSFIKIRRVEGELFHANGRADRRDEANFANVFKNDPRNNDSYSCYRLEHAGKDLKSEPLLSQN